MDIDVMYDRLSQQIARMESNLKTEIRASQEELKEELRTEFKSSIESLRAEFRASQEELKEELRAEFRASHENLKTELRAEMNTRFDQVIEEISQEIRESCEFLYNKIQSLENKIANKNQAKEEAFEKEYVAFGNKVKNLIVEN